MTSFIHFLPSEVQGIARDMKSVEVILEGQKGLVPRFGEQWSALMDAQVKVSFMIDRLERILDIDAKLKAASESSRTERALVGAQEVVA